MSEVSNSKVLDVAVAPMYEARRKRMLRLEMWISVGLWVVLNGLIWTIWYMTDYRHNEDLFSTWYPYFITVVYTIGLVWHYVSIRRWGAYDKV